MEITKCEFCNTYTANFEVHDCVRFGNYNRQTSATLPQRSSTNLAENIELITVVEMDHEARWPSTSEYNSSIQERIISNIHQTRNCEETAAAEMSSQYEVPSYYQYNPKISDFLFPGKPSTEENKSKSLNLQQTLEESEAYRNRYLQYPDASNPEHSANMSMPLTVQSVLPGFQQTFGQRSALRNQMSQHNIVSQMEYHGISRKEEVSSDFLSPYNNFGETDDILTNLPLQYSETSLEIPFLNIQKPQCSTRNLIRSTTSTEETETFPFTMLTCDEPFHNVSHSANRLCCDREGNILNISGAEYPNSITDTISLTSASNISLENPESQVINLDTLKFNEDVNNPKNKQWTDFNSGIAENICYPSRAPQTQQHNFGTGSSSNTEHLTWEHSCPVTYSSEGQIVCNISTTVANQNISTCKKHSEDKIMSEYVNSTEESDTASGKTRKQSSKCDKDHHIFPGPSRTVAKPYNCSFCGKMYAIKSSLKQHVRTHTGDGLYPCTECSKSFTCSSHLRDHLRTHTGEKPFQCTKCGKCFTCTSNLRDHLRTHTGEKPFQCTKCGKCFTRHSNLRDHLRTHTGDKSYACNKCSKSYTSNSSLKRHMLKHAGEERSKCDSCGTEFSSEESLKAHQCGKNK
ncbi:hypothetical protein CDAR_244601 [Caerostris darwini]|uniref:C2H2-type domain-containing protein n=1 Tax=Caerostris darwini TaxID=1538125 RepID=A0AAV4SFJ8_9ARAC|nr:hypothetical protein CDAR_244601 [Caerostris darwini]